MSILAFAIRWVGLYKGLADQVNRCILIELKSNTYTEVFYLTN